MRILLIEDEGTLGEAVRDHIVADGHAVDWMQRLEDGEASLRAVRYGLVLLDLMLPDGSGIDFLIRTRANGNATPVIILTARDQISDRISGLNAGADDYLVKPFDLAELSARIAAVARRYAGNANPVVMLPDARIDLGARAASRDDVAVDLTAKEWAIVEMLAWRPGAIISKRQIEEQLYAFDADVGSNTIEVHVSRLRKKLGHRVIETVRGVGYRLKRS